MKYLDYDGLSKFWGNIKTALNNKADKSSLSTVATSGNYNDLSNKPTSLPAKGGIADSVKLGNGTDNISRYVFFASTNGSDSEGILVHNAKFKYNPATDNLTVGKINGYKIEASVPANAKFTDTTYSVATATTNGLLSSADKVKLDNLSTTITTAIAGAGHLKRTVVSALPTTNIDVNTIYMILADANSDDNKYIEWMYLNNEWEKVGNSDVDLSGYAKTDELNNVKTALNNKADKSSLSKIATSGSYNDLSNKPTIPSAYTLPSATSSALGGVKIGSNITVSSGTISLTKTNVTTALGYTPPTTNTTYSVATTTTNGLMSASDKAKLDGLGSGSTVTMKRW